MDKIIRATVEMTDKPCPFDDGKWSHDSWSVRLRYAGRRMTVDFFTGTAHGEPTAADVMECLCLDAAGYENSADFTHWAAEYGYDADSRKAERAYRTTERQTLKLRRFLGAEYDALIHADEETIRAACERAVRS